MIVALDATPLTVPTGGIARYTWELAIALGRTFPGDEYWLVTDQALPDIPVLPPNVRVGDQPKSILDRRWWAIGLNRELDRLDVEVFHGTDYSVPYRRKRPSVMTIHDLSPWRFTEWQPGASRIRSRTPRLLRWASASTVITPSNAVKKEVVSHFGFDSSRVFATPLGVNPTFGPMPRTECTPYFLYVGTLEPRKNIQAIVEAWRRVRGSANVELVLAGRVRGDFPQPVSEPGLRVLGAVPEADLPRLYSNAAAVLYPSHYEGFGLPVLEAMKCGALVITSNDPAIRETAGGCAVHTESLDEPMRSAVERPGDFRALRDRARHRAAEFTWERTARATREAYEAARALS